MAINIVNENIALLKLLYKTYNKRDIESLSDLEFHYGLLSNQEDLLFLVDTICRELAEISESNSLRNHYNHITQGSNDYISFVKALGYDDIEEKYNDELLHILLTELLCTRVEKKVCKVQHLFSKSFSQETITNAEIQKIVSSSTEVTTDVDDEMLCSIIDDISQRINNDNLVELLKLRLENESLFNSITLDAETIEIIREVAKCLSEEYRERWNLHLLRFDAMLKVFLDSPNLNQDDPKLQSLMSVIHMWRNSCDALLKPFNIYSIYRARTDILEIKTTSSNNQELGVTELYKKHINIDPDESFQSFIKRIQISDPINRGGLVDGYTTKKFYKKYLKNTFKHK
ncbi:uncharacterized protein BBOV_IV009830 [Babesia bovis T2Bo]|uniref:uncharacterized protein n=1 Tax=Babesia bovis T2Bo TaxID=484906 RepID=UPI001DB9B94B|nr:uncharacterized protein BBOV_IV009830 [Babesia bovis T2Bo]EDO07337.2 hypothetical protein BBOV_IV009830 [Babesia bovis T2Bo]